MNAKAIKILATGAMAISAAVLFGSNAYAKVSDCTLVPSASEQIRAVQNNPKLNYTEEVKAELAVRKQLILKTIECAQGDVKALRDELNGAPSVDRSQKLRGQIADKVENAGAFYALEAAKVDTVGIKGSQALAKELIAWRTGSFEPLSSEVDNFVIWSQNQDLFDKAQDRMNETSRAVDFLQKASPNEDLATKMKAAQDSFSNAKQKNDEAFSALNQFLSPDQTLDLIKQSLDLLSETYANFSDVGSAIKKLLPQ